MNLIKRVNTIIGVHQLFVILREAKRSRRIHKIQLKQYDTKSLLRGTKC